MEDAKKESPRTEEEQEELVEAIAEKEPEIEKAVVGEEGTTDEIEAKEEEVPEAIEEEVKPPIREEKVSEEEIVEERIYTIPLNRAWIMPPNKRAPRAMRIIRSFITRHMKLGARKEEGEEPKRLIISNEVNEKIWSRGIEKPPRKIRIRAAKDKEGNVTVYLAEGD
ncbi:50S ribosomal protein L31e [Candidatus Bathyarchaeota archaeon]|nr:50S ribosomal protein L31e [Candidatus Bathyarchaeota archaeon]